MLDGDAPASVPVAEPHAERLHFHAGRTEEANKLIIRHHYSGRAPSLVMMCGTWHRDGGIFGDRGEIVAACVFSIPVARRKEKVLELTRLVRVPGCRAPLTGLISRTVKQIVRERLTDLIVSFADTEQGHHGGIYQAASWRYGGRREARKDGVMVNSVFVPDRTLNSKYGTNAIPKLRKIIPHADLRPHFDDGKHFYWRALSKPGEAKAKRLGLQSLPYPRPDEPQSIVHWSKAPRGCSKGAPAPRPPFAPPRFQVCERQQLAPCARMHAKAGGKIPLPPTTWAPRLRFR
ncbi:MAG: hypothetical protein WDN25_30040 [Acetobacteraceae bacterium]